ncbi:flavin-containing amine oxidoreductase-domain containing protein [Lactarius akahatsu]|uniref:Flavin-containing amine oxidoreductase-domain containing protein n=1 Tax=Lactarius akahatsu TaxID=416441 RepID=A0AAD4LH49_9AGAM|nr:flavin-containing amine oxidoreductase-domain containing protein [Lactarius akahatsu]
MYSGPDTGCSALSHFGGARNGLPRPMLPHTWEHRLSARVYLRVPGSAILFTGIAPFSCTYLFPSSVIASTHSGTTFLNAIRIFYRRMTPTPLSIGIVGAGMAGLYAALLLRRAGHQVHIFEGADRIGGRVHTHYFSEEENQYFEAGAMRIPHSPFQGILFDLIKHVQSFQLPSDKRVDLIPYRITSPGNFVYINRCRPDDLDASSVTPRSLGWPLPADRKEEFQDRSAGELMLEAVGPLLQKLEGNFVGGFNEICQEFDNFSFRFYLNFVLRWPNDVIDFVETVTSQTNQFSLSVTEIMMEYIDFSTKEWSTIAHGMSRLPLAMAHLVGYRNISLNSRVSGIRHESDGRVTVSVLSCKGAVEATFDRVIMAIPPPALRMIADRPAWSEKKELAIRSIHFESLFKMGLRFKTRFWERVGEIPCHGGQSTTDLPIRWIVYPSNGIGEDGPGVLLVYSWMTDADAWLPLTTEERKSLALANLAEIYNGLVDAKDGSVINVYDLIMATSDAVWSARNSTGDAMFLPGQFLSRFEAARQPERNVYFAGEHLSHHHTWIAGALESAWETVADIIGSTAQLGPLESSVPEEVDALDGIEYSVSSGSSDPVSEDSAALIDACGWEQASPVGGVVFSPPEQAIGFNTQWSPIAEPLNMTPTPLLYPPLAGLGIERPMRLGVELALIPGPCVGSVGLV